jgi:hypothetical protein
MILFHLKLLEHAPQYTIMSTAFKLKTELSSHNKFLSNFVFKNYKSYLKSSNIKPFYVLLIRAFVPFCLHQWFIAYFEPYLIEIATFNLFT